MPSVSKAQMFDHMLNPLKGWPHNAALDFHAKPKSGVDFKAGSCLHVNNNGELELGCKATQMALFSFQGTDSFDVGIGFNTPVGHQWHLVFPTGHVVCLVATGAYELETTEFYGAGNLTEHANYVPNTLLRSPTTGADAGKLTYQGVVTAADRAHNVSSNTPTAVVGVVSRGVNKNAYGKYVLAFWPVWYPGASTE
jgi:hypothetical protein